MSSATSIHFDTVTSGVTTITQPTVALAHPLRTVYDYYAQPREKALSLEDSSDSRDAHSFTSSSYASISTVSSFHVTLRDAKLKHVTRFKQWTKRVKEKVLTKFNPHPSFHHAKLCAFVGGVYGRATDRYNHRPVNPLARAAQVSRSHDPQLPFYPKSALVRSAYN